MTFDSKRYRELWQQYQQRSTVPFGQERPALFTPAAAAQEVANSSRLWRRWGNTFIPWQFGSWTEEALAVHKSAFIGDWSALPKVLVQGPQAARFLEHIGIAILDPFAIGRLRHFVMVNEAGKVAAEGVLGRLAEHTYFYTGGGGEWIVHQLSRGQWDATVELVTPDYFMFEVQGPRSLDIVEAAAGTDLSTLAFNHWTAGKLAGEDVRILRTGVSGELGFEVHGPSHAAAAVWETLVRLGTPHGLVQLGHRSQVLAHIEAGIATVGFDYIPSLLASLPNAATSVTGPGQTLQGTYPVNELSDLFRSPFELNWGSRKVVETREFIGSDALRRELAEGGPKRRLVGLIWDSASVVDVFASLFRDEGPLFDPMELPRVYAAEYSSVLVGDTLRGCASSRIYSPLLRRMVSLAVMDEGYQAPGTAVEVTWGPKDAPHRIRATVAALPLKPDVRRVNVVR
jgi:glycine cleavage system aminomethyltransferase T